MIDDYVTGNPPTVIHFEDDVPECFFENGSTHAHGLHLKSLELADNHGKFLLTVHLHRRDIFIWIEQNQAAPAKVFCRPCQSGHISFPGTHTRPSGS